MTGRAKRERTPQEEELNLPDNEFIDNQGYVRIRDATVKGGSVLKHRVVMQEKLGRPLRSDEKVKRLDLDRLNNDPDNLYVVRKGEGDPFRTVAKLQKERRLLVERIKEIDKELSNFNGQELPKPWEEANAHTT
jgi:HNH endonuclease